MTLRYALRSLAKNPGFALVAIVSLALGIGANTAIFSLIDAVMLRSLPVHEPEGLARVTFAGGGSADFTNPIWEELRDRQDVFSGTFAYVEQRFDLAAGGESRPVAGAFVSGGFFPTLGVQALVGRPLGLADDGPACPAVAVLSHGFWRSEYGGDPGVVGRTLPLDGHSFEIVGVAAEGFTGFDVGRAAQVFAPLCAKAILEPPTGGLDNHFMWFLRIVGRLKDGVTLDQARARVEALAPSIYAATLPTEAGEEMRQSYLDGSLSLVPAATGYSDLRMQFDRALLALMVVVGIVLLIACANVANLLLARATARRREMAIRRAVGAGRGQLVRQLLTESLLLALIGAAVGAVFAAWATELMVAYVAAEHQGAWLDVSLNARVLAFTAGVAIATALLFGMVPAWRATRVDPHAAMKLNDRTIAEGHSRFTPGRILVVGQITLSLVLVVVAGLLLGSFRALATVDPGFRSEGVLVARLDLRKLGYPPEELPAAHRRILERLRATPGIRAASASAIVPISGAGWNGPVEVEGFEPRHDRDHVVFFNAVSEDYFATLRTPLLAGREFTAADDAGSAPVAVINEAMARKFFGSRNPIGRRIGLARPGEPSAGGGPEAEVVGVVRDTRYRSLREETEELVYLPLLQAGGAGPSIALEIRGDGAADALIPLVTSVVGDVSPRISISYTVLSELIDSSLSRDRVLATLSSFFGALALLLAVVGLYGTMAYSVARRRGEIGIRLALGAARERVLRMVVGDAGRLVAVGIALGLLLALMGGRLLASFLYGVSPTDPVTLGLSAALLAAVALAAGSIPAWRAARLDPVAVLRED